MQKTKQKLLILCAITDYLFNKNSCVDAFSQFKSILFTWLKITITMPCGLRYNERHPLSFDPQFV